MMEWFGESTSTMLEDERWDTITLNSSGKVKRGQKRVHILLTNIIGAERRIWRRQMTKREGGDTDRGHVEKRVEEFIEDVSFLNWRGNND